MKGPGDFTPIYDPGLDDDEIWDEEDWMDYYGVDNSEDLDDAYDSDSGNWD